MSARGTPGTGLYGDADPAAAERDRRRAQRRRRRSDRKKSRGQRQPLPPREHHPGRVVDDDVEEDPRRERVPADEQQPRRKSAAARLPSRGGGQNRRRDRRRDGDEAARAEDLVEGNAGQREADTEHAGNHRDPLSYRRNGVRGPARRDDLADQRAHQGERRERQRRVRTRMDDAVRESRVERE